jgi:hypothetical protein
MIANPNVPAVLAPDPDPTPTPSSETLTVYLTAPLPDDVLEKTKNPKNLFGKHVLLGELGRGGTGTVIKAWDTYLSRHVALKFLHATAPQGVEMDVTERVQEFLREARIAARVRHPNIVRIHEVDCRDGRYYISMDFIGGGTLAELIHGAGPVRARFSTGIPTGCWRCSGPSPWRSTTPQPEAARRPSRPEAAERPHRRPRPSVRRRLRPGRRDPGRVGLRPGRRHPRDAGLHGPGAGAGPYARDRCADRRVLAGRDPL